MTHVTRFVAVAAAGLPALALCVPVQAQTPEIDALRARAEEGHAEAPCGNVRKTWRPKRIYQAPTN